MEKFNDALVSLDGLNKELELFVPSLGKKVKFKGLTTKQQKDAVKSALEKVFSGISFSLLVNSIINENSFEKVEFLTCDRSYLLVALRAASLQKLYKKDDKEIDLSFVLSNNFSVPSALKTAEITDDNIKVKLSIPTLARDTAINIETKKKIAPLPDDDNLAKEAVGEIYINELAKYIDVVSITSAGNVIDLEFDKLFLSQKIQVIEKLPLSINNKLIDFINEAKAFEKKYFERDGVSVDIDIDQTLFTV